MIDSVLRFFDGLAARPPEARASEDEVRLATAVLLVETMRADAAVAAVERQRITRLLGERFALDAGAVAQLLAQGEAAADDAYDLQRFTATIHRQFDAAQKARVIEAMWQVAYADGDLSAHENHLMRKIADLLYIPLADYAAAKARAREAVLGTEGNP